jgi:hypothetical protein
MDLELREWITLGIAVLGAVLGVLNTLHALRRDRARIAIKVGPGEKPPHVVITVTNRGSLDVSLVAAGLQEWKHRGAQWVGPCGELNGLPHRLAARASVDLRMGMPAATGPNKRLPRYRWAFAKCACGVQAVCRYKSPAAR